MLHMGQFKFPMSGISRQVSGLHFGLGATQAPNISSREQSSDWEPRLTIAFVASVSLILWTGIGSLVWLVVSAA